MKYKFLLIGLLGIAVTTMLSSCGAMLYGTSTKVTIETEKEFADSVNIIAVGPKKVVEYKNVTLPFKMKVKHNNLPLRVTMNSNKESYDPFTINAKRRGEDWNMLGKVSGWVTIAAGAIMGGASLSAGIFDQFAEATFVPIGIGSALLAMGYSAETDVPVDKHYLTSSVSTNFYQADWYQRLREIQDIYTLLEQEQYQLAEAKSRWLLEKEPTGELYYLKGVSNYYLREYKQALKDLKIGLMMVEPKSNPGLRDEIITFIDEAENRRQENKSRRARMWGNIALGTLQIASATLDTYSQANQYSNWQNVGITSSGVITDPSKLSQAQLNRLMDPNFAYQQVMQQEYLEYQEFSRYNKKSDGSYYSFDEFQAFKGQALLNLKEEGIDLVAEQREQNRKERQEWREGLEQDRKERLEQAKAVIRGEPYRGTSNTSSSSSEYTSTYTTVTPTITTSATTITDVETDDNLDSKEQFRRESVSSDDYQRVKDVTLYYREGDKAKVMMSNVELCRKGAYYYIKIGSTYYPRRASNWSKYRNAIAYGHHQLYYND